MDRRRDRLIRLDWKCAPVEKYGPSAEKRAAAKG
jgi:hypothetical protein